MTIRRDARLEGIDKAKGVVLPVFFLFFLFFLTLSGSQTAAAEGEYSQNPYSQSANYRALLKYSIVLTPFCIYLERRRTLLGIVSRIYTKCHVILKWEE